MTVSLGNVIESEIKFRWSGEATGIEFSEQAN